MEDLRPKRPFSMCPHGTFSSHPTAGVILPIMGYRIDNTGGQFINRSEPMAKEIRQGPVFTPPNQHNDPTVVLPDPGNHIVVLTWLTDNVEDGNAGSGKRIAGNLETVNANMGTADTNEVQNISK